MNDAPRPLPRRRAPAEDPADAAAAQDQHAADANQPRGLWSLFGGSRDEDAAVEFAPLESALYETEAPFASSGPSSNVTASPWRKVTSQYEDDLIEEATDDYGRPVANLGGPPMPALLGATDTATAPAALADTAGRGDARGPLFPDHNEGTGTGFSRPTPNAAPATPLRSADPTTRSNLRATDDSHNLPAVADFEDEDPGGEIKQRAQDSLIEALGGRLYDPAMSERDLGDLVVQHLNTFFADEDVPLSVEERRRLAQEVTDDLLRHGPIEPLLNDPLVNEVMVNGTKGIYIEKGGKLVLTKARFASEHQLRRVIERIVGRVGRRIDESSPMVDARLPDGSRVNAIIPPLAVDGPTLTIRKFTADSYGVEDLVRWKTLTAESAYLLESCVKGRLNILVSGGTGSGKTTLLNILSSFIPSDERIVTIEDAVELRLRQHHVIRLESRPPNIEGKGAIHIRDLLRNSLRMRPDRIVVGEVRGGECLDMLQAMNTGHDGSLSTLHANSPRDAISRIETMVLMAGIDLPIRAIREQVASAVELIVHTARLKDGTRRVTAITEVLGMEGDVVTLSDIFTLTELGPLDEDGKHMGCIGPTGLRPTFTQKLADYGIDLPGDLFGGTTFHEDELRAQGRRK